jgi:hypothetical protein
MADVVFGQLTYKSNDALIYSGGKDGIRAAGKAQSAERSWDAHNDPRTRTRHT